MNEDQKDLDQSQNDQNYTETQFEETVVDDTVDDQKDLKSALAQKDHYRAKAKQLEAELKTREEVDTKAPADLVPPQMARAGGGVSAPALASALPGTQQQTL